MEITALYQRVTHNSLDFKNTAYLALCWQPPTNIFSFFASGSDECFLGPSTSFYVAKKQDGPSPRSRCQHQVVPVATSIAAVSLPFVTSDMAGFPDQSFKVLL